MTELRQAAIVAANWWTDKIANPNMGSFSNGDTSNQSSFFAMMLMSIDAIGKEATDEQLKKFCEMLSNRIEDELSSKHELILSCDYGPDNVLTEIAEVSNIYSGLFPIKRTMWITADSVEVRDGYGEPVTCIYPKKDDSKKSEEVSEN